MSKLKLQISSWSLTHPPLWARLAVLLFLLVGVVTAGGTVLAASGTPSAVSGERMITIFDGDETRVLVTNAGTVADALRQADIALDSVDNVEPALGTELVAGAYSINIYRARPVVVVDGTSRVRIMTAAQSGSQIAAAAGIELRAEDQTDISRTEDVLSAGGAGLTMTISRAVSLHLVLYGQQIEVWTQAKTVGQLLDDKNVRLASNDSVSHNLNDPITANMQIEIWHNGKQTITVDEDVPFETEQIKDADRSVDFREVKQAGQNGKRSVTYEIDMKDGREMSRREIQSVITTEPKKQIEIVGTQRQGSYTTPSENENITWDFLIRQGFTREQTAGIMGNLKQEHGFKTSGDGLAQWTGGRKTNLMRKADPYNIYTQLEFLMEELNGGYSSVKSKIQTAKTVDEAVRHFQNGYEKCGVCNETARIRFAYDILASH